MQSLWLSNPWYVEQLQNTPDIVFAQNRHQLQKLRKCTISTVNVYSNEGHAGIQWFSCGWHVSYGVWLVYLKVLLSIAWWCISKIIKTVAPDKRDAPRRSHFI